MRPVVISWKGTGRASGESKRSTTAHGAGARMTQLDWDRVGRENRLYRSQRRGPAGSSWPTVSSVDLDDEHAAWAHRRVRMVLARLRVESGGPTGPAGEILNLLEQSLQAHRCRDRAGARRLASQAMGSLAAMRPGDGGADTRAKLVVVVSDILALPS